MEWLASLISGFDPARAGSIDAIFAASELATAIPAALLVSLPFLDRLRWRWASYAAVVGVLVLALLATAPVLAGFSAPTNDVLFPALVVFFVIYARAVDAPLSKLAGVYLSAAMLSSFVTYAAIIVDTFLGGSSTYLAWPGLAMQWALWALAVALLARPLAHRLPAILNAPVANKRFWNVFWILPLAVTCALVVLVPTDTSTLLYRRVGVAAVVGISALFVLTALSYALLIRLAGQATSELATQRRESALSMRVLMQGHLEKHMEDAKRARHDQRQHDRTVRGFLDAGDLTGLSAYLDTHEAHATDLAPLHVCDNPAVNAVAVYYWDAALRTGADVEMRIDLPRHAGFDDDELVVLLGNLLENAVEALEKNAQGGFGGRESGGSESDGDGGNGGAGMSGGVGADGEVDESDAGASKSGGGGVGADGEVDESDAGASKSGACGGLEKAATGKTPGKLTARAWRDAQGALFIRVSNTCAAPPAIMPDGIASTKHAGAGLGTASVRAIAEAHKGTVSFSCKDGVFTADVMLGE